jgi:hypothetical protein
MSSQYPTRFVPVQAPPYQDADVAQGLGRTLAAFLFPLLVRLDQQIDKRLVRTFLQTIEAILTFRDRIHGLLLSELGGYILSAQQCSAGTKRLANLLHSPKWSAQLIHDFLWQRATRFLAHIEARGDQTLVLWDESVWEKAESEKMDDLCPVRSSKASRLTRVRRGYYRPRGRPIFVAGLNWLGLLVVGASVSSGPPMLAATRWWTSRGPHHDKKRRQEGQLLLECVAAWGRRVIHVFDQGFAGVPWVSACLALKQRFVMRWPKGDYLRDAQGCLRKPWQIARGKRARSHRLIWDARRHTWRLVGVLYFPVEHPELPGRQLWLVVSRPGKGRKPWYLLTTEPVTNEEQAWPVVFWYSRRWQLEMSWRFLKSELGLECPRVRSWEVREKLLMMAVLPYAFLLSFLTPAHETVRYWLLESWCHRRGRRAAATLCPLYRLRLALSRLWSSYRPQWTRLGSRLIRAGPTPAQAS